MTVQTAAPRARQKASLTEQTGSGKLHAEAWLIGRLGRGGPGSLPAQIVAGTTDYAIRAERVRQAILSGRLESVVAGGARSGRPETFAQVFERVYGEPLITQAMKAAVDRLRHR